MDLVPMDNVGWPKNPSLRSHLPPSHTSFYCCCLMWWCGDYRIVAQYALLVYISGYVLFIYYYYSHIPFSHPFCLAILSQVVLLMSQRLVLCKARMKYIRRSSRSRTIGLARYLLQVVVITNLCSDHIIVVHSGLVYENMSCQTMLAFGFNTI
jgi:hypothetical protein